MLPIRPEHPLRQYFAGLVDNVFVTEIGVADPILTDYLADLLVSFTHVDRFRALQSAADRRLEQIASMLLAMSDEVPATDVEHDRSIYRHIGDYSLFWAGVYPEQLAASRRRRADVLLDYVTQGKRSYAIVSDLTPEDDVLPPALFRHLSDDFESCLHGLGLVRRGLECGARAAPATELLF
jgi:hypothetical protein